MLNDIYQHIDPIAFSVGPLDVRWYGIAYVLGFLLGVLVLYRVAKRWKLNISEDDLATILLCVMFGVILGARIGYVTVYGANYYAAHPLQVLNFSKGGMSFHGGLVGAIVAGIVASRMLRVPCLTILDLGAIVAPIGLFFGRCANFINGELWGAVTDLSWGVVFGGSAGMLPRHPSQLYEALLEGVLLLVILLALSYKKPPLSRGIYIAVFLTLYGCFRFAIEFVRQPDAQLGYLLGTDWLTMGQVLSMPLIVFGVCLFIYAAKKQAPQAWKA